MCKWARAGAFGAARHGSRRRVPLRSTAWEPASRSRRAPPVSSAPLPRGRSRRRHDAARQAALEDRSRARSMPSSARLPHGAARRLRDERQDDDVRDGGTHARRHASACLEPLRREPRLGRRLHPPRRRRRRPRPARGGRVRAAGDRAPCPPACRRARQSLPRPARPLRRARAHRRALARRRRRRCRRTTTLVVNADDPLVAELADGRTRALRFGVDDPRLARTALQHAADSKYCIRCGTPYAYAAAYVGHLGDYRCPACGHAPPAARRRRPRDRAARPRCLGLRPRHARRVTARAAAAARPLQRLQRARRRVGCASRWRRRSTTSSPGSRASRAAFGRFERIEAGERRILMLLIKNPAGANEAVRTLEEGGVPPTLVVALNDEIADGRDVSWIWDVDFEPLLDRRRAHRGERRPGGGARASLHVRRLPRRPARGRSPTSRRRSTAGSSSSSPVAQLVVLPTYTAMLRLRAVATERGLVRPYWEDGAHEDPRRRTSTRTTSTSTPIAATSPFSPAVPRCAGTTWTSTSIGLGDRFDPGRARPPLRRRRAGPRAGARSLPTSPRRAPRSASPSPPVSRCSPSAVATSCSAAATAAATAPGCREPRSSRTRRSPARRA